MAKLISKRKRRVLNTRDGHIAAPIATIENTETLPNPVPSESAAAAHGVPPPKVPSQSDLYGEFWSLIRGDNPLSKHDEMSALVGKIIQSAMRPYGVAEKYNWIIIHDPLKMLRSDSDKIYKTVNAFERKRDVGLIITSGGGEIEPAYLISKLCREAAAEKFIAVVPRRAKSAATLLCCGADEIHMGQMSELGPIDPQFDGLPALGLKHAVQHLAELASQHQKASDMLAKYLASSLKLENLGYYERIAESAVQYADRLLRKRILPLKGNSLDVAKLLVYGYMDHSFVIDKAEAQGIFGADMIQAGKEYEMGNTVYEWLSLISSACESAGYGFYMYGQPSTECNFYKKGK